MFKNPHIIYIIAKQKHEDLLAECRMIRLANEAKKKKKKDTSYPCRCILFVADILIKIGIGLKRRWEPEEESNSTYIISQEE